MRLSVVFVCDYSGSMSDAWVQAMAEGVHAFIDRMRFGDEGMYIAFDHVIINQSGKFLPPKELRNTVTGAGLTRGWTALYDAIYQGLEAADDAPFLTNKAVIALTDGMNNRGTSSTGPLIQKANDISVPVFTIGLGTSINSSALQNIADETGGIYLERPTADDLQELYHEVMRELAGIKF